MAVSTTGTHVTLLDPTVSGRTRQMRELGPVDLQGKVVGLLENTKRNSREILEQVGELLRAQYGVRDVRVFRKHSASQPLKPELLQEMVAQVEVAIAGIGD